MNLSEILKMAGSQPFSTFKWGPAAVLMINDYLAVGSKLSVDSTGQDAEVALSALPTGMGLNLLTREVQVMNDNVMLKPVGPEVTGVPPTVAPAPRRTNPLVMMIFVVLGLISMGLTASTIMTAHRTGQMPDSTALVEITKTMVELIKDDSSRPDKAQPADPPPQNP